MADPIFHITTAGEWRDALEAGRYTAPSLADEGFIHTSTIEQVPGTAQRYYSEVPDLVLLVIDPEQVAAEIRWEESRPGELLPAHLRRARAGGRHPGGAVRPRARRLLRRAPRSRRRLTGVDLRRHDRARSGRRRRSPHH